jgi:hypothetical protein
MTNPAEQASQALWPHLFDNVLITHASTAVYLAPAQTDAAAGKKGVKAFRENRGLWEALFEGQIRQVSRIRLESFAMLEWFPRSPGLYFTSHADYARRDAAHRVISTAACWPDVTPRRPVRDEARCWSARKQAPNPSRLS